MIDKKTCSVLFGCLLLVLFAGCGPATEETLEPITIDIWYGDHQQFGNLGGHPQRWINILGNASPHQNIASLQYSVNEGPAHELSFAVNTKNERPGRIKRLLLRFLSPGPRERRNNRLALPGDFNVELLRDKLTPGTHQLSIIATSKEGISIQRVVAFDYVDSGDGWPLPYEVDWSRIDHVSDAVQVVDGKWELTPQGIRIRDFNYDRLVAFGDDTWTNYEVSTTVTFHNFTPPKTGVNSTGVTHAAIAARWPGHDQDGKQPSVKWFPLGATAEFRIGHDLQQCRWRIFDGKTDLLVESDRRRAIELERTYQLKVRVETMNDLRSRYRAKCWPLGEAEPDRWDLERYESDDLTSGSALLVAHHTDVTFGNLKVMPVEPENI